jgi:RNA polymerase sigma factor (sigma-70 family)
LSERSDEELITAVGQGDHEALGALFQRHHKNVHSLCFRLTGDSATADDLVQEAFIRVLRFGKGFESRAAFSTWLYRITRNVCMDHLESETRNFKRSERMQSELNHESQPSVPNPRVDSIREALYRLSPEKREVLVLSRYEGMSYKEIALICQTTVGAIKVRAHRAIRELRREYEKLERAT